MANTQNAPNFMVYNHGKRSIKLNLQSEGGRGAFRKLLDRADVLVENYRPGVLARLGFGPEVVSANWPRLIHCSITGFGTSGPYSARPAFDTIGLALSGIGASQWDPEDPQIAEHHGQDRRQEGGQQQCAEELGGREHQLTS